MIRVAFTLLGGKGWTGGYNYLYNLVSVLSSHKSAEIKPVMFFGDDCDERDTAAFTALRGVEVIQTPLMSKSHKKRALINALIRGYDPQIKSKFNNENIDLVFEAAQFFGRKLNIPAIGWIPDFQHRILPELFSKAAYWKREIGFRAQIASDRTIMLSSKDALDTLKKIYPSAENHSRVVNFAIPPGPQIKFEDAREIADLYHLPDNYFFLPNQYWKHKNHLLVLEALARLKAKGEEIVVAASGAELDPRHPAHFEQIKQTIADQGLCSNYHTLGLIPFEHLAPLSIASRSLLNPSTFEGWSTTVEEAKTLGVQMILSDLPVHKEQAGNKAIYFDRTDPDSLAKRLKMQNPTTKDEWIVRAKQARVDAVVRTKKFADEFLECARFAIQFDRSY